AKAGVIIETGAYAENIVEVSVINIDGPAIDYRAGTGNHITAYVGSSETLLKKDVYNDGGTFDLTAPPSGVDNKIIGSQPLLGTTEKWMKLMWGADDLATYRGAQLNIPADAVGFGTLTFNHGLIQQPAYTDMACNVVRGTGTFPLDAVIEA